MTRVALLSLVLILLVIPSALAVGFYVPKEREFIYQPGGTAQYALGLIGPGDVPVTITLEAAEEIRPYITISDTVVNLRPGEVKKVLVTINFPPHDITPGVYRIVVTAAEGSKGGGGVSARTRVQHTMLIINPAQGQYPAAKLRATNTLFDEPTGWSVDLTNYGLEKILDAYAEFEVLRAGNIVASGTTNRASVIFRQTAQLIPDLLVPDGTPGLHTVRATVHAGTWTTQLTEDVVLGRPDIQLDSYTNEVTISRINEFAVGIQNIWEETVTGSVSVTILADGQELHATNPNVRLEPWKGARHALFLNVPAGISPGEYSGHVTLSFLEEPIVYPIKVKFISLEEPTNLSDSNLSWIVGMLVLIVISLLVVIVYRRKNARGHDDYL